MIRNSQAEAQAAVLSRGRAVSLAEPLEDVGQELRLNAYAVVADSDLDLVPSAPQSRFNAPTFVRELDRVREQIPYGLLQAASVAKNNVALGVDQSGKGYPFHFSAW